jgi:hypothetical protein
VTTLFTLSYFVIILSLKQTQDDWTIPVHLVLSSFCRRDNFVYLVLLCHHFISGPSLQLKKWLHANHALTLPGVAKQPNLELKTWKVISLEK